MVDVVLSPHDEAMSLIYGAHSVTTLSYEEVIAIYLRARGILRDGEEMLGAPIPSEWSPLKPIGIEDAWGRVMANDALKPVRAKLSIHDLRMLIRAISGDTHG